MKCKRLYCPLRDDKAVCRDMTMHIFSILKIDMPFNRIGYAFLKVIIWKRSNGIRGIFNLWVDRMDESLHILF